MKKFLLSAALISSAILVGNAQTLTFLDMDQNPIANGGTYTFEGWEPEDVVDGQFAEYASVIINPDLYVVSSEDDVITVQATSLTGAAFQLCTTNPCVYSSPENLTLTKDDVDVLEDVPLSLKLESIYTYLDEVVDIPYIEILIEAWSNSEPENKISMTLKMGNLDKAGVEKIASQGNVVKILGKTLTYDVTGNSAINIYSLSGKTVVSRNVSGNGSINLGNLPKGVYVYKVAGKTGKFIIK